MGSGAVKFRGSAREITRQQALNAPDFLASLGPTDRRLLKPGKHKCFATAEICDYIKRLTYSGRNSSLDPKAERGKIDSAPNIPIG
jgi:hypothetical protein